MKRFEFNYHKDDSLEQWPISCEDTQTGEHLEFEYLLEESIPASKSDDPLVPSTEAEYQLLLNYLVSDHELDVDSEQWQELEQELKLKLE